MATYAQLLNGSDQDALTAAGNAYNEAKARGDTAGMAAAHQQAENIRSQYGYSGGANGSQSILLPSGNGTAPAVTEEDSTKLGSYGSLYNDALARYNAAVKGGNMQAAKTAQADMYSAHAAAENLRAQYGYSGGANGSQVIPVSYIDKNGNSRSGSASLDYYNNLLNQLNTMYQSALSTNNASYAAQLQAAMASLEKQKQALNLSYDNSAKQLYIDKRMSEKNAPQALAAQGYNGGLTESSLMGIQSGYEQNLLNNEQSRNQGLADLEYQKINAQSENAVAAAQAAQQANDNYYSNYANLVAQMVAQKNYEDEQSLAKEQTSQSNYQNLLSYLYSTGMTPTAAQLSNAYGISQGEAQTLLKSYAAKGTSKSVSKSGSTGKSGSSSGYSSSGSSSGSSSKKTSTTSGGSNYAQYTKDVAAMKKSGQYSTTQIKQAVYNAYKNGELTDGEYQKLMNQARGR